MSVHRITGNDEIGLGADDVGGDGGDDSRERRRGCGLGGEVLTAAGDDVEARKGAIRRGGEIKGRGRQAKFKERKKDKRCFACPCQNNLVPDTIGNTPPSTFLSWQKLSFNLYQINPE